MTTVTLTDNECALLMKALEQVGWNNLPEAITLRAKLVAEPQDKPQGR